MKPNKIILDQFVLDTLVDKWYRLMKGTTNSVDDDDTATYFGIAIAEHIDNLAESFQQEHFRKPDLGAYKLPIYSGELVGSHDEVHQHGEERIEMFKGTEEQLRAREIELEAKGYYDIWLTELYGDSYITLYSGKKISNTIKQQCTAINNAMHH
jgi:hypothetical protein